MKEMETWGFQGACFPEIYTDFQIWYNKNSYCETQLLENP
jgi:hypothetical protein